MKVLHLVSGGLTGGAARAALELHDALLEAAVDSHVLHSHDRADSPALTGLEETKHGKLMRLTRSTADVALGKLLTRGGDGRSFSLGAFGAPVHSQVDDADILHLHWINGGGFRLPLLRELPKPTVWTFHDMWALTGGCHYAYDCRAFEAPGGCQSCPALGHIDLSGFAQRKKARAVRGGVQGVAVSKWLAAEAEASLPWKGKGVVSIPNAVDTRNLWPVEKNVAREALGLDPMRSVVLTGHASSSFQKGADLLAAAVRHMQAAGTEFDLLGFGHKDAALDSVYSRHLGYVQDKTTLRLLYSAADVFAFPSRTEAFGRTIIEAFACGTPVVAFSGSGPDEIIVDGETGRLIPAGDARAFAHGIIQELVNGTGKAVACRLRAEEVYSKPVIARQYKELYYNLLAARTALVPSPTNLTNE